MNLPSIPGVRTIGLGCATFGREIDEQASFALLNYALEKGVTYFDTAAAYGEGVSEGILGRWLALRQPTGVVVSTKVSPPYLPPSLAAAIDTSLRRLGRPSVDVLYLHRWDPSLSDESLATLETAKQAGKIGALGISNITPAQLAGTIARQKAAGFALFGVLQCNQNYAVSEMGPEMQAVCAIDGLEVVTFSPLGAGFLTGKHRAGVVPGSRFDLVAEHQACYFQPAALRRLEKLQAVAVRTAHPPERLALAWALRRPGVSTVLIGGRTTAHIDQALAARDFKGLDALIALDEDP